MDTIDERVASSTPCMTRVGEWTSHVTVETLNFPFIVIFDERVNTRAIILLDSIVYTNLKYVYPNLTSNLKPTLCTNIIHLKPQKILL